MHQILWASAESTSETLYDTLQEGVLPGMVEARYASYTQGLGQKIRAGKVSPCFWHCRMPLRLQHFLCWNPITFALNHHRRWE